MLLLPVPKRPRRKSPTMRKLLHEVAPNLAVIFSLLGIKALLQAKDIGKSHDGYSVHTWLGILTALLFFGQVRRSV